MRLAALFLIPIFVLSVVGWPSPIPRDVDVGDKRATFNKKGTRLVSKPKPMAKLVKLLPYGTALEVTGKKGRYIEVTATDGEETLAGWMKASSTVEPFALTQGGQFTQQSTGTGQVSRRDAAAAARQFSPTTEAAHRQASAAEIRNAYRLLDSMLEVTKPTFEETVKFVRFGRLGRPDADTVSTPEPNQAEMPPPPVVEPESGDGG